MRVLLLNYEYPPFGGGAGNATQEIARALARLGHGVTVWTGGKERLEDDQPGISIVSIGSRRRKLAEATKLEMLDFVLHGVFRGLKSKRNKFDAAIVFFAVPCGPVATTLKVTSNVPYVVSLRGGDVPGLVSSMNLIHKILTPVRRWVYRHASAIIANSQSLRGLAEKADRVDINIVPNGVDSGRYCPNPERASRRVNSFQVLIVCRFHRQKKLPETIEWLAMARESGMRFEVRIVGDGAERRQVEDTISHVEMEKEIRLEGWLAKNELIQRYQSADCLLNMSNYEGLPNTVLEAMSCGLPVIASDIPPHRELISHGENGFLASLDALDPISEYLFRLLTDLKMSQAMGQVSRNRVKTRYSWDSVAASYLEPFRRFNAG